MLVGERRLDVGWVAVDLHRGEALERLIDQNPQLEAGERGSEAEVAAACAERLVLGVACDVEAVGVLVAGLIAVGGRVPHHDLLALADRLPVQLGVAGGGAGEMGERREHAQRLLDDRRHERAVRQHRPRWSGFSISARIPLQ